MFISTMLVTYFAHGPAFSAGVMKNAMLSGTSVVVYAVAVRIAYPPMALWAGTLVALFVSLGSGWAIYRRVIRRVR
jgi:branched-subunit amino acid ABC-type transport system permease component